MAKLTSHAVNYSRLSPCQEEMELFKDHQNTHGHSERSHSNSHLGNFWQQYLPELLVNVYSYHLISNPVTHTVQLNLNLILMCTILACCPLIITCNSLVAHMSFYTQSEWQENNGSKYSKCEPRYNYKQVPQDVAQHKHYKSFV